MPENNDTTSEQPKKKGRRPDYRLKAYEHSTKKSADVGAGWVGENGVISITLNLCAVLEHRHGITFNLFPVINDEVPY